MSNHESQYDVVTNVQPVLASFIQAVREEMPDLNYVYDPELSYETAIVELRNRNNSLGISANPLPLLAYKHSALRYPDEQQAPNRRLNKKRIQLRIGDEISTFTALHAEMDVDLLFISQSMEEIERFQIAFLAEEGISEKKELIVNMGEDIGDLNYFVQYNEILDINMNIDNNYYKGLVTSIKIRGFYLLFKDVNPVIKQIITNYRTYLENINNNVLIETKIIG